MNRVCHMHIIVVLLMLGAITVDAWGEDSISVAYTTTSQRDTLFSGDSTFVIHTVCAPICSSHVRVYTRNGKLVGTIQAPERYVFPEAYIEDGKILWRDNTPQLLDDSEKRTRDRQTDNNNKATD